MEKINWKQLLGKLGEGMLILLVAVLFFVAIHNIAQLEHFEMETTTVHHIEPHDVGVAHITYSHFEHNGEYIRGGTLVHRFQLGDYYRMRDGAVIEYCGDFNDEELPDCIETTGVRFSNDKHSRGYYKD